jgi:RNA polymerase sigma-70 factor (ECF subfamily)
VAIWQHASNFSPDRSAASTWMTTIVRNRCLDRLRVQPREISVGDDEDGSPFIAGVADTAPGPEELGVERQSRGRFDRILNALPGHYRQALTLAYCHGLTHAEISRHLAIPLGTAKSWVRRGLEEFARRQGGSR